MWAEAGVRGVRGETRVWEVKDGSSRDPPAREVSGQGDSPSINLRAWLDGVGSG